MWLTVLRKRQQRLQSPIFESTISIQITLSNSFTGVMTCKRIIFSAIINLERKIYLFISCRIFLFNIKIIDQQELHNNLHIPVETPP